MAITRNFFKVPKKIFEADLIMRDKMVLIYLLSFYHSSHIYPSINKISKACGTSNRTVHRALDSLREKGFIVYKSGNSMRSNEYYLSVLKIDDKCSLPRPLKDIKEQMEVEKVVDDMIEQVVKESTDFLS